MWGVQRGISHPWHGLPLMHGAGPMFGVIGQLWGVQAVSHMHLTPGGRPSAPCSIFSRCRVGILPPALAAFTSAPRAAVALAWSQLRGLGAPWFVFRVCPYPEQSHPAPTVPILLPLRWNNPPTAADGYFRLQPPCPPLTFHSCWSASSHPLWSWAVGI